MDKEDLKETLVGVLAVIVGILIIASLEWWVYT